MRFYAGESISMLGSSITTFALPIVVVACSYAVPFLVNLRSPLRTFRPEAVAGQPEDEPV